MNSQRKAEMRRVVGGNTAFFAERGTRKRDITAAKKAGRLKKNAFDVRAYPGINQKRVRLSLCKLVCREASTQVTAATYLAS